MSDTVTRVLICAPPVRAAALERRARDELGGDPLVTGNAIDAVSLFVSERPTHVIVDAAVDGRGGTRVVHAMTRLRAVPTVVVVSSNPRADGRQPIGWAGLQHVQFRVWTGGPVPALFRERSSIEPSPGLASILSRAFDAIVLLGSAGTPHMLPSIVPELRRGGVPLVVAVHHNARLSDSFAEWVGELAKASPEPLHDGLELPMLTVARATAGSDVLQPNLDQVLLAVLERCRRLLIVVTSGMEFEGIDAVRLALQHGATLVGLRPELCPQPAMVQRLLEASLEPNLYTSEEIARLIRHCSRAAPLPGAA